MTRRYRKRAFMYLIIAAVIFVIGGFYLNAQLKVRSTYLSLKEGETALAQTAPLSAELEFTRYSYTFVYNGKTYASTTLLTYTADQMSMMCRNTGGLLPVKFILKDGEVVLSTSETTKEKLPIAESCEENYFSNSVLPGLAMSVVFFCVGGILMLVVLMYVLRVVRIRAIEKDGTFAYGVFVEAYPSRFGSSRYMAVRYSYLNDLDEWVEAVTPYAYSAATVEMLKALKTIEIKYKGKSSVITESFKSRTLS